MYLKLFPTLAGTIFMIYVLMCKNKIVYLNKSTLYSNTKTITILNSYKFFKYQFYAGIIASLLLILSGILIFYLNLPVPFIILTPTLVHISYYFFRVISIKKNIIEDYR